MPAYRERLWPSAWVFGATALVIPASLLVFLPINIAAGVVVAVVLYGGALAVLIVTSPVIAVSSGELVAGRARLPLEFAGEVQIFEGNEAFLERGRRLDARAWLVIRGWVKPVVKVPVLDPRDPVPYWLVSTRRPHGVAAAIERGRAHKAAD